MHTKTFLYKFIKNTAYRKLLSIKAVFPLRDLREIFYNDQQGKVNEGKNLKTNAEIQGFAADVLLYKITTYFRKKEKTESKNTKKREENEGTTSIYIYMCIKSDCCYLWCPK